MPGPLLVSLWPQLLTALRDDFLIRGVGADVPTYAISAEVVVKVLAGIEAPGAGLQSSAGLVQRISPCCCKKAP